MFNGMETLVLSETLVQKIVGVGFPSAKQFKVSSAGAVMVRSLATMLLGGATNTKDNKEKTQQQNKTKILFFSQKKTPVPISSQKISHVEGSD